MSLTLYNECHVEVLAKCRYREAGSDEKEVSKRVSPGRSVVLRGVTAAQVQLSAMTADREYVWEETTIELDGRDHTHVLSCVCDPHTHDCPQVCLHPSSRQLPEDGTRAEPYRRRR